MCYDRRVFLSLSSNARQWLTILPTQQLYNETKHFDEVRSDDVTLV